VNTATARPAHHLVVPLIALSALSAAGTLASPWLLRASPVLLMVLSPRLPFLALAAPKVGVVPFVVVGTVRLCLADPFHFLLGRRLGTGPAGGSRVPGMARLVRHARTRQVAAGAVLVRPIGRHVALAGAAGVRSGVVVGLDLAGTLIYLVGVHTGIGAIW
jgi:hypothetical protein